MRIHTVKTPLLNLAYEDSGPKNGRAVILVHGWPDSPRTFDAILEPLHSAGYRTVVPYLRGYGPSEFRSRLLGKKPLRTGQPVAFAQDIIDLADALKIATFDYIGHDWGARTGYVLAALFPKRLGRLVALSVPFEPGTPEPPKLPQAQAFWYQWLFCTEPGEQLFRKDPVAYGRAQWNAWSPKGWYTEAEFKKAAASWQGKDFQDVVLHSYRSRWKAAPKDPAYQAMQTKFEATKTLGVPTLLIHGVDDTCELKETTDGAERYFTNGYDRVLLSGVGHFPTREAPERTVKAALKHLRAQ